MRSCSGSASAAAASALSVGNGIGGAIGPWFGGVVHDVMGSYRIVFRTSMVFCAVGSTCFWLAGRRSS
jgi:cyanate permease